LSDFIIISSMHRMKKLYFISCLFLMMAILCCRKPNVNFQSPQLSDYLPLQAGKSITYRLDSLEFVNFGTERIIVSYQAMDIIDTTFNDNLGRPSWIVNRYLSDTTGTAPWTFNETYMITATRNDVEVVENNLRFIKLVLPVLNGFNWLGNSYIDTNVPIDTNGTVNNDPDLSYFAGWTYIYANVGSPFTTLGGVVPNSVIVNQTNQYYGDSTNSSAPSGVTYSQEVYGNGIGLIYKNLIHWEYQPPNIQDADSSYFGYGIQLNMISHN
jgi:hypothetical protein